MNNILIALITLTFTLFSNVVFADDEDNSEPLSDPVGFVGDVVENTATTATGAVVGTAQTLGDMGERASSNEEQD